MLLILFITFDSFSQSSSAQKPIDSLNSQRLYFNCFSSKVRVLNTKPGHCWDYTPIKTETVNECLCKDSSWVVKNNLQIISKELEQYAVKQKSDFK